MGDVDAREARQAKIQRYIGFTGVSLLVLFVIMGVVVMLTDDEGEGRTEPSTLQAAPPPPRTPQYTPPPTVAAPTIPCKPAPDNLVAVINASFTDSSEQLVRAVSVEAPKDMIYIAGDIEAAGRRVSSADVWMFQHGAMFALSSDARRRTIFADGRDFASAGDEYGAAVQECISR
jgi:hypothetical protein